MKELDNELIKLCGKLRDEEITSEELSLLEERLDRSPEDRSFYLRFMQIDSLLEKFPPIEDQQEIEESISSRKLIRLPAAKAVAFLATAAALAVACTLGFQSFFENQVAGNDEYFAQDSVGTLILAEDCEWEDRSFSEGQRLPKGTMELEGGTAVVRFDGGAEAVLTGPVGFQIDGPTAAMLLHGEVVVRAEDDAIGFILDTPSGRLVDLGTEFAVKVEGNGETELHVHEGAVALGEDFSEKPENVIGAGHAVRIHGAVSGEREDVDLSAPRFQELIDRLNPQERRDLMTAYEGFHVDPGVYLPEELTGGKGWDGPWRLRSDIERKGKLSDTTDRLTVAMSQMDVAWPIKGGQLGMLELPEGPNIWIRKMKKPVRMGKWSIRYLSFLVTEPGATEFEKTNGKYPRQDFRFTLRSTDDYFGESLSIGWESSLRPRVATENGPVRAMRTIPEGETVFCIAKIETRKTYKDRISFRFYSRDEILDIVEPSEWDVVLTEVRQDAEFDLLVLTSNSQQTRFVDEIRVGPTWRSVTPIDPARVGLSTVE